MNIEWLREQYQEWLVSDNCQFSSTTAFIDWLEATGASPWRSVEDEMPGDQVSVLVVCEGYIRLSWAYDGEFEVGTTHWMPVPPLPQEQQP